MNNHNLISAAQEGDKVIHFFLWRNENYLVLLGRLEVAKLLVDRGADINAKNKYSYTAFMLAAQDGNYLKVDSRFWRNENNFFSVLLGHLDVVNLLIDHWAVIDVKNYCHYTALMLFTELGNYRIHFCDGMRIIWFCFIRIFGCRKIVNWSRGRYQCKGHI